MSFLNPFLYVGNADVFDFAHTANRILASQFLQ